MGYARIRITSEFLVELLHLPADTRIVASKLNLDTDCDVEFVVKHADIVGDVNQSTDPPLVCPRFHKQEPVVFEGWGQ